MSSPAITTVIKMMESLPKDLQDTIAEHLREYLEGLQSKKQFLMIIGTPGETHLINKDYLISIMTQIFALTSTY